MNNERNLSSEELLNITGGSNFLDTKIKNEFLAYILKLQESKTANNTNTHIHNNRFGTDLPCYGIKPKDDMIR